MNKEQEKNSENLKNDFTLRLLMTYKETIVDGIGLRYSLYFAGCSHACPGCHNEYSWNPNHGNVLTYEKLEEIAKEINENTLLDGITISGGDPLFNPTDMLKVLKFLKAKTGKNIWLYTGYTIEQLREDELRKKCLKYVDVLVDGRFVKELYNPNIKFRGSSNQRIINKEEFFIWILKNKIPKTYRKNSKIMLKCLCKIMFYKKILINRGEKWKKKLLSSILVHNTAN